MLENPTAIVIFFITIVAVVVLGYYGYKVFKQFITPAEISRGHPCCRRVQTTGKTLVRGRVRMSTCWGTVVRKQHQTR